MIGQHLITIDPDTKNPGVALFDDGFLQQAFADEREAGLATVWQWLTGKVQGRAHFVIECPQTYGGRASGNADANDLIALARIVGRFEQLALMYNHRCEVITPAQWKGQTPKGISTQRTWDALVLAERNVLDIPLPARARLVAGEGVTSGRGCDVMDAVGIGLRALGRTGRKFK